MPEQPNLNPVKTLLSHRCWCGKLLSVKHLPMIGITEFQHFTDEMAVPDHVMFSEKVTWEQMVDGFVMACHDKARKLAESCRLVQVG
jgi:hypothetical protein